MSLSIEEELEEVIGQIAEDYDPIEVADALEAIAKEYREM